MMQAVREASGVATPVGEAGNRPVSGSAVAIVLLLACAAFLAGVVAYRGTLADLLSTRSGGLVSAFLEPVPAPGFALWDAAGDQVTLASLRGRVLVLGFIDPQATEARPIVVQQFLWAAKRLGERTDLLFVAVNSNPADAGAYDIEQATRQWGLTTEPAWRFLTGPPGDIAGVQRAYQRAAGSEEIGVVELFVVDGQGRLSGYMIGPGQEFGSPRFIDAVEGQLRRALLGQGGPSK